MGPRPKLMLQRLTDYRGLGFARRKRYGFELHLAPMLCKFIHATGHRAPPFSIACLKVRLLLLTCAFMWWPSTALALLEKLPFFEGKHPFELQTSNNPSLAKFLTQQLNQQRQESSEFKLLSARQNAINFDRDILTQLLESEGYFGATISSNFETKKIVYTITSGEQYLLKELNLDFPPSVDKPSTYLMPVQLGEPLKAEAVIASLAFLKKQLLAQQCLFELKLSYTAEVDHQARKGFLTFHLAPSQNVLFGNPYITGAEGVARGLLNRQLSFKEGDCFNRTAIEQTRIALLNTNLLTKVEPIIKPPIAGEVVVGYRVIERSHRTLKAGIGYNTDTETNLLLGWQHRNFFGAGQKFDAQLDLSNIEQSVISELTVPHFLRDKQTLILKGELSKERPSAYEALQGNLSAIVSRPLKKHFSASVGAALELSRVEKDGIAEDYNLASLPVGLAYNKTDSVFNPTEGVALSIKVAPYLNLYQTGIRFVESSILASAYYTPKQGSLKPTFAARLAAGTIIDASLGEVPADHRFYVGGGGSVRGYQYQSLGQLNQGAPIGGLSFSEVSLELRLRFGENWGAVLFGDGGYAFAEKTPQLFTNYLWSAGIGLRYFTSFAPIRLDIAKPLDSRTDPSTQTRIDDPFQIYINIGQAF